MRRPSTLAARLLVTLALIAGLLLPFAPRASAAPPVIGAIAQKWNQVRSIVGEPLEPEFCGLREGGCAQRFQRGMIYWSPASGAAFVRGSIQQRWGTFGWETGFYGYPTTDEFCGLRDGGCGQHYQRGSIYWSPATGAYDVRGAIRDIWSFHGWEGGMSGYPTSGEFCGLRDGGCGQRYQNGAIYYSPAAGTHRIFGAIWQGYSAIGWETSSLGYATEDEFCGLRDGGCAQRFTGGSIYWSPASGAYAVKGAIAGFWAENGWENGRFGYPRSNESCRTENGVRICDQDFTGGRITWRSDRGFITGVDCRVQKCIALTFDDGPSPYTDRLLDTLSREGVKATFFTVGYNVSARPATMRRMRDLGMEIGSHTVNHPDLRSKSESEIRYEIGENQRRIESITGVRPGYLRPPYGAHNPTVERIAAENRMAIVNWSYDTWDWRDRDPNLIANRVINEAGPNSVVLMHDLHSTTVDAAPAMVRGLKERGYTLVTVSELLGPAQPGQVHFPR
ncbi:polysaccharide deacetylase family protein [Enemella evansiae]|uniref:polysaccharide deacetylase family protein n=1 Tax=Enemella evansiae TaxID=2016499 RepID=UPI000B962B5C|nr:polysaccharide deacetylase family protein [Enemella evansiae]OYO05857.1 hypothetical protein CGZ97_03975 [Enemella evansiae]